MLLLSINHANVFKNFSFFVESSIIRVNNSVNMNTCYVPCVHHLPAPLDYMIIEEETLTSVLDIVGDYYVFVKRMNEKEWEIIY